jgi:hypothetical protein
MNTPKFEKGEIVAGRNCGIFRIESFETSCGTRGAWLKEVAPWDHTIESPNPPLFFTLDMIVKHDTRPLTIGNAYLIDVELHVEDATYHLSKVIRADSEEDALRQFEDLVHDKGPLYKGDGRKHHYLQVKSMYGLVADNLKLMTEI